MSHTLVNYPSDAPLVKLAAPPADLNASAAALNASLQALADAIVDFTLRDYAAVAAPAEGMLAWDFARHRMMVFDGAQWIGSENWPLLTP
jgi:hypothetical protein